MSMSPLGPPGPVGPKVPPQFQGGHPGGAKPRARDAAAEGSPDERAAAARRQALDQVGQIERQVEETRRDGEKTVEHLKDQYERRSLEEESRQELATETQRNKGYERIRELQRAQQAELNRVKREGDKSLGDAQNYYRQAIYNTRRTGDEQLTQELRQTGRLMEFEKHAHDDELTKAQTDNRALLESARLENEKRLLSVKDEGEQKFQQLRETTHLAHEKADANYREKFEENARTQADSLGRVFGETNRQLQGAREDGARRLAAYADRNRDPFYRMVDLDADLYDLGDAFVLTATIPKHEQDHVGISVKGDDLVLTGSRRNEEKLDLGGGHARGTAAYQSFSETFKLGFPVEARQISKEFDGDRLVVTVPKKIAATYKPKPKPEATRSRVERPNFPENLPLAKYEKRLPEDDEEPHLAEKSRGTGSFTKPPTRG